MPNTSSVPVAKLPDKLPSKVPSKLRNKLRKFRKVMNQHIYERESENDGLLIALLGDLSVLFLGQVGTAKTKQVRSAASLVGMTVFDILLSETTKPEAIFGPPDIPALAEGKQLFKYTGYAPDVDILFLDEIFKSNAIVLNGLLWLINEKIFRNGDEGIIQCPIKMVVAASNEIPSDTTLRALYDRLILRYEVGYINEKSNMIKMMQSAIDYRKENPKPIFHRNEIELLRALVKRVVISNEIFEAVLKIRDQVKLAVKVDVSDRRINAALRAIQATAVLHGRMKATIEDTEILSHIFWDSPEQQTRVQAIALSHASADVADILGYEEVAESVWQTAQASGELETGLNKLKKLYKDVKRFKSKSAKVIANKIKGRIQRAEGILDSRKEFVLIRIESDNMKFYKVSTSTVALWTMPQLRACKFRWRRKDQYWWSSYSSKKLKKIIKQELGVTPTFHSISTKK